MPVKELNPYLHFDGQADDAIRHYEQALGATLEGPIMRYADAPMPTPASHETRVMHAQLRVDGCLLMLSDAPPGDTRQAGGAIDVAIEYTDDAEMAKAFDGLADGGKVTLPLADQFWGGRLGMLVDRFGVQWILLRNPRKILIMATTGRLIFPNLAVRDLQKSMAFFKALGFDFNPQFTDEKAACMVISDKAMVMLLTEPFFKGFTKNQMADTSTHTECFLALSCESREAVNAMVEAAVANGGRHAMPPQDHGFMYGWSFYDLDGHHWEPLWMDPSVPQ